MASAALKHPEQATFASVLKECRSSRGLTQEELAEQAGLSARLISDLERGIIHRPRRETIRMLADGLSLSGADRDQFVLFARNGHTAQPGGAGSPPPVSLPVQPTPLIGRDGDIEAALAILRQTDARVLTMTGPGGVGKTRLALASAERLAAERGIGADFVDLSSITDAVLLWPLIAVRFDVNTERDRPLEQSVVAAIGETAWILVLDNLEQVREAGRAIAWLHAGCPNLIVIATSRGALHIRAEQVFAVPPLAIPGARASTSPAALAAMPSVQLLVQRAQAVNPAFAVSASNAEAIAGIVTALDGLPLAIELAAARLRVLSPADLLDRLDPSLPLLTGGSVDLPPRLQSVRAAVAWSYGLLNPDEQSLLRALSVFAGGFTLAAAERCANPQRDDGRPILDWLEALVDKGLVLVQGGSEQQSARYRVLQPIREFGQECLRDAGEEQAVRDAHAQWAAWLAEQAEVGLVGPDQQAWFDGIEREHDNVRAALTWTIQTGDAQTALRIAGRLTRFWASRGCITEAREWQERSLALPGSDPSVPRGGALTGLGVMAYFLGDLTLAEAHTRAAAAQYEACGHQPGVAYTYGNLGMIADAAGQSQEAVRLYERALAMFREQGDRTCTGYMLNNLGLVTLDLGDLATARTYLEQALVLNREDRNADSTGYVLSSLGSVELAAGNVARAAELHREALQIRQALGSIIGIGIELDAIAQIAADLHKPELAATLYGAAARLRLEYDIAPTPQTHARSQSTIEGLRELLGPDHFSTAWERGVALTTDEAVDLSFSVETPDQ